MHDQILDHDQNLENVEREVADLHEKITALIADLEPGCGTAVAALALTIANVAGAVDCADCRRQLAKDLKRTPWLLIINGMNATLKEKESEASETKH